jgi:hypothetical protein
MNNYSQRLSKLEPGTQNRKYLEEVGQRLVRYGVETRHRVMTGTLPQIAWGPEADEIYQAWTKNSDFESIKHEILARPSYSGDINAR